MPPGMSFQQKCSRPAEIPFPICKSTTKNYVQVPNQETGSEGDCPSGEHLCDNLLFAIWYPCANRRPVEKIGNPYCTRDDQCREHDLMVNGVPIYSTGKFTTWGEHRTAIEADSLAPGKEGIEQNQESNLRFCLDWGEIEAELVVVQNPNAHWRNIYHR